MDKKLFIILLFFFLNQESFCQTDLIRYKKRVDSIEALISNRNFDVALIKLETLSRDVNYSNEYEKLKFDLLKAKVLFGKNDRKGAMDLLLNGLDELQSKNKYSSLKISYLTYIGGVFIKSKDQDRAMEYYKNALKESVLISDTLNIVESYLRIGTLQYNKGFIDSSNYYYKTIINFPIGPKTENTISRAYNNLCANSGDEGDLDSAVEYANKSIDIKLKQKDTVGLALALMNLSGVYYDKNQFNKALSNYEKAFNSLRNINSDKALRIRESLLFNLAYSHEMLKDYELAYKYLERASDLKDSLTEASIAQNLSEIDSKFNVEKQARIAEEEKSKRENAQLRFYGAAFAFLSLLVLSYIFYRNYRLKQQNKLEQIENESQTKIINATVDAKEKERKAIAETLHDSVSALLSSANLHLQATKAQLKKEAPQEITKAQAIVNEASVKIRDLSHELISSVLLKFGLAFAVHDMCQKYSNSEITLHSDDDGIKRYDPDFEIKIHNIVEELVNNILKHSKASNATIMLAHRNNDMLSVRVSDDGIGFNPKTVRGKDGLGLSHIEARIKVMKGVFNIISSKENGTNIFISVPIKFKEQIA